MLENPQRKFITTQLDPHILSTPFKAQTNWHVVTGAPSCGKSTLINLLASKGYQSVPESARQYMEQMVSNGQTIEEVHANAAGLQRDIFEIQLGIENALQPDDILFLDGALPGSLAWYRVFGLDPNEILQECFHHRYASVFILDPLPHQLDGYRFEDGFDASFLDQWHTRDYQDLGYEVVRVPVLPPEDRLAFFLEILSVQGLC